MAYTQLSPAAIPGQRYSFSPKTAAGAAKGIGPFTELSALGLPGGIHSFSAKTVAEEVEEVFYPLLPGGGGGLLKAGFRRPIDDRAYVALQDENDVITVLMIGLGSGIIH